MLMPGEMTGPADGPYLGYLRALWKWDQRFPGFGHDTHGIETRDGVQYVQCLRQASKAKAKVKAATPRRKAPARKKAARRRR
jgi:hypothetical protein